MSLSPYKDDLVLVERNGSPLPGIKFINNPGHTPHHSVIEVTSQGQRFLAIGDSWISTVSYPY